MPCKAILTAIKPNIFQVLISQKKPGTNGQEEFETSQKMGAMKTGKNRKKWFLDMPLAAPSI